MKVTEKKYMFYIVLGLLYIITKMIWHVCGFVYLRGVVLGLIASVLTVCIGFIAFRESRKSTWVMAHRLAIILPLIILALIVRFVWK